MSASDMPVTFGLQVRRSEKLVCSYDSAGLEIRNLWSLWRKGLEFWLELRAR